MWQYRQDADEACEHMLTGQAKAGAQTEQENGVIRSQGKGRKIGLRNESMYGWFVRRSFDTFIYAEALLAGQGKILGYL